MTDDDIPESVARGVERALFGGRSSPSVVVAVRRPRRVRGTPIARQIQAELEASAPVYVAEYEDED